MKLATDNPEESTPQKRLHSRTGNLVAELGKTVLSRRLPPWPTVVLLIAMLFAYTARTVVEPFAAALEADVVTADELDAKAKELRSEQRSALKSAIAERERDNLAVSDLGEKIKSLSDRIDAGERNCPRDLALLLRWATSSEVIDGEALPADLKLCMLLREKEERG